MNKYINIKDYSAQMAVLHFLVENSNSINQELQNDYLSETRKTVNYIISWYLLVSKSLL